MSENRRAIKRIGVLVGGGPAPGINTVIAYLVFAAERVGVEVVGILDGCRWLMREGADISSEHFRILQVDDARRIRQQGGSELRTRRDNPTDSKRAMKKVIAAIKVLKLDALVTIGGDDTLKTAMALSKALKMPVVHEPKTIDRDLPCLGDVPTFGFETARHYGVEMVERLCMDASTTHSHCHVVVTQGRGAGFLALGIGKGAGAHVTIIPEEFGCRQITLGDICDIIEGTLIKRIVMERPYAVVLLAEGLALKMSADYLERIFGENCVSVDEHENLKLGQIDLGKAVCDEMRRRCNYCSLSFVDKELGYDLRSAVPIPFDAEYCIDLGSAAVPALQNGESGLVTRKGIVPFAKVPVDESGTVETIKVDVLGLSYQVARSHMIRLESGDDKPDTIAKLARAAKMTPVVFRKKFGYLMK